MRVMSELEHLADRVRQRKMNILDLRHQIGWHIDVQFDAVFECAAGKARKTDGCHTALFGNLHRAQNIGRVAAATKANRNIAALRQRDQRLGKHDVIADIIRVRSQRRQVVGADADDHRARFFKFGETSLVRREFLRSTTGESGGKECQDDILLAAEAG